MNERPVYETRSPVAIAVTKIRRKAGATLRNLERQAGHRAAAIAAQNSPFTIQDPSISYFESGAPYFAHAKPLHLSISHSEERAIAAISDHPIGIDIEKIRNRSASMLSYICTEGEHTLARSLPDPVKTTAVWTIKESVMKAAHKGLAWSPRKVIIEKLNPSNEKVSSVVKDPEGHAWNVHTTIDPEGYVVSIAIPCQNKE